MSVDLRGQDVGVCGAFVGSNERCDGRLRVVDVIGDVAECECDRCGSEAGCPVGRLRPVRDVDADRWWDF